MIKNRRIGRFWLAIDLINSQPESCMAVFSKTIILEAKTIPWNDMIEYVAICDAFDEVPEGGVVPCYTPWLKANYDEGGNVTSVELAEWKRA